jgi:uncharacterized membrane protein (UPF0127 family)
MLMLLSMTCAKTPSDAPDSRTSAATTAPASTTTTAPRTSGPRVIFPDAFVVQVEIAADDENRAQGLMYRDQLRPGTGMLFLFAEEGEYPFWMKNTRIPLDMIWIDSNRRIAAIHHDVPPCQIEDCPSYPPNVKARYVLEVAGGVAKQHGLKVGDILRFEQTEDIVVR